MKKKRQEDEQLERGYQEVKSVFSFEVLDKTLVNMLDDQSLPYLFKR